MPVSDLEGLLVAQEATIREALSVIDRNSQRMALVADPEGKLLGVVTDGDVRRGILRGVPLDVPVVRVMNPRPQRTRPEEPRFSQLRRMKDLDLPFLVQVDEEDRVAGIVRFSDLAMPQKRVNPVLLMAGGRGSRLWPLTESCPKPMLRIGDKPILELILENLIAYGFERFILSVNYLGEQIERHFGDGASWGVHIEYLREESPLDTAGALGLLSPSPESSLLVMNGDILTDMDFAALVDRHEQSGAAATLCLREVRYEVPYGVVEEKDGQVAAIREKPVFSYQASAGIYVLEPRVCALVEPGVSCSMPALLERLIAKKERVCSHLIRGLWMDVGRMDDFEKAREVLEIWSR